MSIAAATDASVLWFLPTHGDGRHLGTTLAARPVTLHYLRQIARAADELGYFGALLPTGRSCEDSWVVASALAPLTERLRYLVAVRPGLQSPTVEHVWTSERFTAIMVSHDVAEAVTLADRVLMIDQGEIALDLRIDLPRPRESGSSEVAAIEGRILRALFRNARAGEHARAPV